MNRALIGTMLIAFPLFCCLLFIDPAVRGEAVPYAQTTFLVVALLSVGTGISFILKDRKGE